MTNTWQSSALKLSLIALLGAVVGCGDNTGLKELEKGDEAYKLRDFKKAAKFYEDSIKQVATNPEAFVRLARVRLEAGELQAAAAAIKEAGKLIPNDIDVKLISAQIAFHKGDYALSVEIYNAVANNVELDAVTRARGFTGLGIVEMTCNNRAVARVAFLSAIKLDRRNPSARYHLALLYRDAYGYNEAALEQFEIFVRLDEKASVRAQKVQRTVIPDLRNTIARAAAERPGADKRDSAACAASLQKADAAYRAGQFKTARFRYDEAYKLDPLSYQAALGLARSWEKTDTTTYGKKQELSCYLAACKLSPSAVSTYIAAGERAEKLSQNATAVEVYSRALAADPSSKVALDGLIRTLSKGNAGNAKLYRAYRELITKR